MRALTFVSYLTSHADPISAAIADSLGRRLGRQVSFDADATWQQRRRWIEGGQADVYWMCGLLTTTLFDAGRLGNVVAAPVFPGRPGPVYRSVVVTRAGSAIGTLQDLRGARLAINERDSWSGYHALRVHLASTGRAGPNFGEIVETGGHEASIEAVLAGSADVAAIDDTVWEHRLGLDDRLRELVVVDRTQAWPTPPFSLSRSLDPVVGESISPALTDLRPAGLDRIVPASSADYDPIRQGMTQAAQVGW